MPDPSSQPRLVTIGVPDGRRVALLQAAMERLGLVSAVVVPWLELLEGRVALGEVVRAGDVVRIDSPGRDFAVQKALLMRGLNAPQPGDPDIAQVCGLEFDRGRLLWPGLWYRGFCCALRMVASQLAGCPPHRLVSDPDEIAVMFDKRLCQARLLAAGVPVPRGLGSPRSYNELFQRMQESRCPRVFVKLAHGSSASGVVALQTNGRQVLATTTVEMAQQGGELRLYNSRRLQTLDHGPQLRRLIDELCRHEVHVEQWLPKAGIDGRRFDLRILVIAGRTAHVVVRSSTGPITNLHLLNRRGDVQHVRQRMGEQQWAKAMAVAERAVEQFPRSLHGGVDLLIGANWRQMAVLEVNAFGDLLPGVLWNGLDTYEAQLRRLLEDAPIAPPAAAKGAA